MKKNPEQLQEEERLVQLAQQGDGQAEDRLMKQYKGMVRSLAQNLYLPGSEKEDLLQEGMIGLFHAISSYRPERSAGFGGFAKLCIERQMYSAIGTQNRKKNQPMNERLLLSSQQDAPDRKQTPEDWILDLEKVSRIRGALEECLSPMELKIFTLRLEEYTDAQIAARLGKTSKSVENAVSRVKKKLRSILENIEKSS